MRRLEAALLAANGSPPTPTIFAWNGLAAVLFEDGFGTSKPPVTRDFGNPYPGWSDPGVVGIKKHPSQERHHREKQ